MNRPLLDDFENFIENRINAAEDRLDRNKNFKAQRLSLRQNIEALSSTLNPQQTDTFTAIDGLLLRFQRWPAAYFQTLRRHLCILLDKTF